MGCCENINNIIRNKNKDLSNSYYSYPNVLKEENLLKIDKSKLIPEEDKIISSPIKNNSISRKKSDFKKNHVLDKINEVESEYKESSINISILTRDKVSPKSKIKVFDNVIIKNRNKGNKGSLSKIKNLRKKRSQDKNRKILSDDRFNKKLNEYNNMSMNYAFHLNNLTRIKTDSKNNILDKTMGDLSFKDHNFIIVSKRNLKRVNRNVKFKLFNESLNDKDNEL